MGIIVNPIATSNAAGSFNVQSGGYVQGIIQDDPVNIYKIAGGVLKSTQSLPVYAGMAISEFIPTSDDPLGSIVDLASNSSVLNITGFTVFNSLHSAIISQSSNVPTISGGMGVQFCRLGSGVRVPLACDPALISIDGGLITQQVSWDFTNQQIVPYNSQTSQLTLSSLTWSGGVASATSSAANTLVTGDWVTISGATPSGYNGDFKVIVVDSTHFTYSLPVNPGASPATGSPVVLAGGGALTVKILKIQAGNSRVAVYNSVTGSVNYNNSGACALVIL